MLRYDFALAGIVKGLSKNIYAESIKEIKWDEI